MTIYIVYWYSTSMKLKKYWKIETNPKSALFGKRLFIDISIEDAAEQYAKYRVTLALAEHDGKGVPFVRTFREWLEKDPIEYL